MGYGIELRRAWLDGTFGSGSPASVRFRLLNASLQSLTGGGITAPVVSNNRSLFPLATLVGEELRTANAIDIGFGTSEEAITVGGFRIEDPGTGRILVEEIFNVPQSFAAGLPVEFEAGALALYK